MKVIFLVDSIDEVGKLKDDISKYPDSRIFALNYFAHNILAKNSIKHEIGDNYLSSADKNIIDKKTVETTSNWHAHQDVEKSLLFDGINLANLVEMELFDYISKAYKTALTIIRIIEHEKPQTVVNVTDFHDLIKKICESNNINLIVLDQIKYSSTYFDKVNIKYNIGSLPLSITISKEWYKKIKNILESVTKLLLKLNETYRAEKKSILLLDFNPAHYELLINELSKFNKNILLLNQRRPAVWSPQSFQIVRNSGCKIVNLNDFRKNIENTINRDKQAKLAELSTMWNLDSTFEEIFEIDNHRIWNSIKDSFSKMCNTRFLESTERILLLKELFSSFNISVILEWAETGQQEKEAILVAKKYGIKSVMLQHAMPPNGELWDRAGRFFSFLSRPLISDKQAVWGEMTKKYAVNYGHNPDDLVVVGSPRHDKFFHTEKTTNPGIILLATTGVSEFFAETSTVGDYIKFNEFVREVCRVVKTLDGKRLILKPHPQPDFVNNIIDLIKKIDPDIQIILDADLVELINSCELLITFKNSTIALESIILNKPTISLQTEDWAEKSEIVNEGAILSISKIEDIESGIRKILYDDEFRTRLQKNSQEFVQKYLANGGSASKTLANFLANF
jgi:hypothetical protein